MGLKVLLIDDSPMMRKMIMRTLRQADVEVDTILEAGNGQEGLEQVAAGGPDLILCDWNMPVLDGLEFVRQARPSTGVPILMVTTESTPDRVATATEAGANGFVTKPFTPERLGAAIREVLDARQAG